MPLGDGRRKKLEALQEAGRLEPIEDPDSVEELKDAITAAEVPHCFSVKDRVLDRIGSVHDELPAEAKSEYVQDDVLIRRINSFRRQFNEWRGRAIRWNKMPGPMEAGPANYPTKKRDKRSSSERKAYEELKEKLDRVWSGAKGGRQRALNAIGSSVAEQNEKQREDKREERRDEYEPGDVVVFRNPRLQVGRVVRLNTKSVRVEYPNPSYNPDADHETTRANTEDVWRRDTIQLDSEFLVKADAETVKDELDERGGVRGYDSDHPAVAEEAEVVA